MRIVFVRHGEPDYAHDCLTPLGELQAKAAAERLREEGIGAIYTSPQGRARQTADAAAEVLGLTLQTLDFMHELHWGSADREETYADGHPWHIADELVHIGQDLTDPDWPAHLYYRHNRVVESVRIVEEGIDGWLASLGYVREGLYYRNTRPNEEQFTVALFSHGGSSSAAMGHLMNLSFPYMCAVFHLPFTGITTLRFDRHPGSLTAPVLELAGDGRHIRGVALPETGV
ncbi:MAG: histidine phosphatase family protein [Clostridiales bacterium]|nr:histidine phosphatase family protein [Clostridiales bacterium]